MSKTALPKRLYKYQPFSTLSLANLKNKQIWFSKPSRFNDPFDCSVRVLNLTDADRWRLHAHYKAKTPDITLADIERGLQDGLEERQRELSQCGVCCFSEERSDLLMWGHYADGHRGFCLEFDTSLDPFSTMAYPVVYSAKLPSLNVVELLVDRQPSNALETAVLTKSDRWAYEREWRLLHREGDRPYKYSWKALTGIYFGAEMSDVHEEIICLILHGSPTSLYRMSRSSDDFGVVAQQFTYEPYQYSE